jgi:sugar phosphate isomerase/epimerase
MDTRRRSLLGLAGLAMVPRAAWARAPRPASGHPLKLGVASYSLREFPLDRALEMCRALEVSYINLKDVHLPRTEPAEATRATCERIRAAGLTILGGGTITMKKDPAQLRRDFEYAKAAGFPLVVAAPEPDALDLVEGLAREFDIKVAIHNHGPEDKFFPAPQDAYKAVRSRDARLGLCMDVGHALRAGADPVQTARDLRDRLYDIHLKDLRDKGDRDSQTEVGKGLVDVPGLFAALREIRYEGHVGLEYEINAKDPLGGMKESFAYMRGVLDGLASSSNATA